MKNYTNYTFPKLDLKEFADFCPPETNLVRITFDPAGYKTRVTVTLECNGIESSFSRLFGFDPRDGDEDAFSLCFYRLFEAQTDNIWNEFSPQETA